MLLASLPFNSLNLFAARTAFEKMTDVDYQGETYYTIRNLSLYECQVSYENVQTLNLRLYTFETK